MFRNTVCIEDKQDAGIRLRKTDSNNQELLIHENVPESDVSVPHVGKELAGPALVPVVPLQQLSARGHVRRSIIIRTNNLYFNELR